MIATLPLFALLLSTTGEAEAAPSVRLSTGARTEDALVDGDEISASLSIPGRVQIGARTFDSSVELDCLATEVSQQMICAGVMNLAWEVADLTVVYDESTQELTWTPVLVEGASDFSSAIWAQVNRAWASELGRTISLSFPLTKRRIPGTNIYVFVYDGPTILLDGVDITAIWR
jgi:hypothetical protein